MTKFRSVMNTQILNFRSFNFGQEPSTLDIVKFGIRAVFSLVTGTSKYICLNQESNSLNKIKKHCSSLEKRAVKKASVTNQVGQNAVAKSQYIFTAEEFVESINENGDLQLDGIVFVNDDLDLSQFPNIKNLPDRLYVDGNLTLSGCSELKALSQTELKVSGSLIADNCKALGQVTKDIRVGGDINFENCILLGEIPENIMLAGYKSDSTHRKINLKGTAINPDYELTDKSTHKSVQPFKQPDNVSHSFEFSSPFDSAIRGLIHGAGWSYTLTSLALNQEEEEALLNWVEKRLQTVRLCAKNEQYKHFAKVYAQKIVSVLKAIEDSPAHKELVMDLLQDRSFTDLGSADQALFIDEAFLNARADRLIIEGDEKNLKDVARQLMHLNMLASHLAGSSGSEPTNDVKMAIVEIRHALSKQIDLPYQLQVDENQAYSMIDEEGIIFARGLIRQCSTPLALDTYLSDSGLWRRFRERSIPSYSSLEECDPPEYQKCGISRDFEKDMILYKKQSYAYENFKEWYLRAGKDPINEELDWSNVKRYKSNKVEDRQQVTDDPV